MSEQVYEGLVKFFNEAQGFGFIAGPGDGDTFVHASALAGGGNALMKGQKVRFKIVEGSKGRMQAADLTLLAR